MPRTFRLNGKAFFLTYPQCNLAPEELGNHLNSLGLTTYLLVAREKHQDGTDHLHALAIYLDKKNISNCTYFDTRGFHPNVQTCRDRKAVKTYITKGDPTGPDLFTSGVFEDGTRGSATRAAWQKAKDASTSEEVHAAVAEASPRDYVLSYERVVQYAATKRHNHTTYVPNADDVFFLPETLTHWVTNEYTKQVCSLSDIGPGASPRPHLIYNRLAINQCLFLGQAENFIASGSSTPRENALGEVLRQTYLLERHD